MAPESGPSRRITVSQEWVENILGQMELRLVREIGTVRDAIPSDARVRELAREEMGIATRASMNMKTVLATVGMFALAVSTLVVTLLRNIGHGHTP